MSIELEDHLLNDGSALVLCGERGLEDSDLAQVLDLTDQQREALAVVVLSHTNVTGACLRYLARLPRLRELYLNGTQILATDPFELFGGALEVINLDDTKFGDCGVPRLRAAYNLRVVSVRNTRVSDHGVHLLGNLHRLQECYLEGTGVSDHARRRLENSIQLASVDLAWAFRAVYHQLRAAGRLLTRPIALPHRCVWARG